MKKLIAFILIFVLLLCAACTKANVAPKNTEQPATVPTQTEPPAPEPEVLEGITLFDEGTNKNEAGDVQLRAVIAADAKRNGKYLLWLSLYQLNDTSLIAVYSVSDQKPQPNIQDAQEVPMMSAQCAVCFDLQTGSVTRTVEFPAEQYVGEAYSYGYFNQTGSLLWYIRATDGVASYTAYNAALDEVRSFTPQAMDGMLSPDGTVYYRCDNFRVYAQLTDGSAQPQEITLSPQLAVTQLEGAFFGADGAVCLQLNGYAADMQQYNATVEASSGEIRSMQPADSLSYYCQNGLLIQTDYDTGSFLAVGGGSCRFQKADGVMPTFEAVRGGRILFSETVAGAQETWITLTLADVATGVILGTTNFTVPSAYAMPYSYCISDTAVVMILSGADGADGQGIYRWDYPISVGTQTNISATPGSLPADLPEIMPIYDPSQLLPQPASQELSDLRTRADALEAQYGIELFLAQECAGVFGGYAVIPVTDHDTLASALDTLEAELTKYPDGFFRQFTESEISIYLAGELKGVESDNLEYAGGFQAEWKGRAAIVIDCRYTDSVISTLHHEISHAIDGHLTMSNTATDDTRWNSMNPSPDCYTYDYGRFGTEDTVRYTYWQAGAADAYFYDEYSLTFEKEDRARLFEHLMSDGLIDWENAPHLLEKINYFAECIRAGFDTVGWQDVYWERYLDD